MWDTLHYLVEIDLSISIFDKEIQLPKDVYLGNQIKEYEFDKEGDLL